MKNIMILSGIIASVLGTTLNAYNDAYNFDKLPKSTHVQKNKNGGYTWTDSGNPNADNILDRLPSGHSLTPDGRGGYYYN